MLFASDDYVPSEITDCNASCYIGTVKHNRIKQVRNGLVKCLFGVVHTWIVRIESVCPSIVEGCERGNLLL